jgi:predicted Zn-dependent protease
MALKRKKLFKTAIFLCILVIVAYKFGPSLLSSVQRWLNSSFCDNPVAYSIGSIDDRFGMSELQLMGYAKSASDIWENGYGKEIFIYDPKSPLEINMIFDDRQMKFLEIQTAEDIVNKRKMDIESSSQTYDSLVDQFKEKTKSLNDEIEYWNNKGGAPKDEYEDILRRQKELSKEVDYINKLGDELNKDVDGVNFEISELNSRVSGFNLLLGVKPEIGTYTSGENKIDIYFYTDENYLINTIAHEMGHALGLGHIDQPNAIMNPEISEETQFSNSDKDLINSYCLEKSRLDLVKNDIQNYLYTLLSKMSLYIDENLKK